MRNEHKLIIILLADDDEEDRMRSTKPVASYASGSTQGEEISLYRSA